MIVTFYWTILFFAQHALICSYFVCILMLLFVVVYHVTIVAMDMGCWRNFGLVICCVLRATGSSFMWNYADPLSYVIGYKMKAEYSHAKHFVRTFYSAKKKILPPKKIILFRGQKWEKENFFGKKEIKYGNWRPKKKKDSKRGITAHQAVKNFFFLCHKL